MSNTLQRETLKSTCEEGERKVLEKKHHLKDHWISSMDFPFVSGTQMVTNPTVKAHTNAYMVKVPDKNKGGFWLTNDKNIERKISAMHTNLQNSIPRAY